MVAEMAPETNAAKNRPALSLINQKESGGANGLETATFTVCTRIRPVLESEVDLGGENFLCILSGGPSSEKEEKLHTESAVLFAPKLSIRSVPELTRTSHTLDYVFSGETEDEIYDTVGSPLVERALCGRTGVIFAYGQTGSGKTHTMNNVMDRVARQICGAGKDAKPVKFSYLEIMGNKLTDCLVEEEIDGAEVT